MTTLLQPPLTETFFYILLAVKEPLHGYGIIQKVEIMTEGRIQMGPGTLYGAVKSLLQKGMIALFHEDLDSRKKDYILTEEGAILLQEEIARLEELLRNGKKVLGGTENE